MSEGNQARKPTGFSCGYLTDDETKLVEWRRLPFDYKGYVDKLQFIGRQIPVWLQARINFLISPNKED